VLQNNTCPWHIKERIPPLPQMLTPACSKAEKGARKSAKQWSRDAWLDMGVLSVTLFAYVTLNKKLAIDM
jgi:hypothetical protein